mmetsp:Transcript_32272/g.75138  ORF Transcript_32272/g.75138 Transcript_32272/m.75138 type:complete len:203 (+) Transcript_32272:1371-1979(+)
MATQPRPRAGQAASSSRGSPFPTRSSCRGAVPGSMATSSSASPRVETRSRYAPTTRTRLARSCSAPCSSTATTSHLSSLLMLISPLTSSTSIAPSTLRLRLTRRGTRAPSTGRQQTPTSRPFGSRIPSCSTPSPSQCSRPGPSTLSRLPAPFPSTRSTSRNPPAKPRSTGLQRSSGTTLPQPTPRSSRMRSRSRSTLQGSRA